MRTTVRGLFAIAVLILLAMWTEENIGPPLGQKERRRLLREMGWLIEVE